MRRLLLALLILAFGIAEADARRRHRHHRVRHVPVVLPREPAALTPLDRLREPPRRQGGRAGEPAAQVPPDWQLQPPDPQWDGRRYVAPGGAAWLALYTTPVEQEPLAAHMRTIAFADGEEIASLRGEGDRIAVAGRKGDRMFYRKAVLACGGKSWRHVAFEYPAELQRSLEAYVARAARALEARADEGCEAKAAAPPQ